MPHADRTTRPTFALLIFLLLALPSFAQEAPPSLLGPAIQPLSAAINQMLAPFQGQSADPATLSLAVAYDKENGERQEGLLVLSRESDAAFALQIVSSEISIDLLRTPKICYVHSPKHGTVLLGEGTATATETPFTLSGLVQRVASLHPGMGGMLALAQASNGDSLLFLLKASGCEIVPTNAADAPGFDIKEGEKTLATILLDPATGSIARIEGELGKGRLVIEPKIEWTAKADLGPLPEGNMKTVSIPRVTFETSLLKAFARMAEVQYLHRAGKPPRDRIVEGKNGRYEVREGQRIVRLWGTPFEIGMQHGLFLANEARQMVETTLHIVGLSYALESGKWLPGELGAAAERLDPFTPPEYIEEMRGLAEGTGIPFEDIHITNYFPALFHCSGFAIKGKATRDGRLYHGRILDYMTGIGFEETATLFAVSKEGKIPFVNISYAGFIGSVTGMNAEKVSFGEMGGKGEGDWDGVTMPILVRMGLENAHTLEEAKAIFRDNPRTCEYYYVFADGKDRSAVGVAAVPERIEFIEFAEEHPRLPTPVEDCVLLSAGSRYENLCRLVQENYGKIGAEEAMELMNVPVAMSRADLHNVLFIPEDLEFWVANAGRKGPAYKEPYYHYTFADLFGE